MENYLKVLKKNDVLETHEISPVVEWAYVIQNIFLSLKRVNFKLRLCYPCFLWQQDDYKKFVVHLFLRPIGN